MKKIFSIFFTVLFVFAAVTLSVSAAKIDVDDKGIYYSNLLDFNKDTNALWAQYDETEGKWVALEIDEYSQPTDADGKICSPILTNKYSSYSARTWSLIEDGEVLRIKSNDASVYPGVTFMMDAAHMGAFPVGQESSNPAKAEYIKIRVRNNSACDQITFGCAMNHTNNGVFMAATLAELTVDMDGNVYESSGEWRTYTFSMYELNKNTNYDELIYDPEDENPSQLSRWPGNLYEFLIFPFGYNVTDGTGNYPGATVDIDYVVIGSKDYVTNYQSALEIKEGKITGLELVSAPNKTKYVVGDSLDLTGLELKATFNDGTTETLSSASASVATFDKVENKVQLKYGKETVEFPVEVVDIASIEMVSTPAAGTVFEVGDLADGFGALANDNNVKVKVNYTDGSSTEDLVNANFQFRGSFKEAGTSTVTVYYYGKSTSFDINLIQVSDIEITPKKTYRYGNSPKIGDFDINFIYSDGSKLKSDDDNVAIELTYNEDDLKQYITKTPGKMSIEIKATNADYNLSFTKTVEIEVETPIRVDVTAPKKAEYMQGETFEADGLKVQLVYDNKGKEAKVEFKKEDYTYNASTRVPAEGKNIRIKTDIPGLKEIFDDNKVGFTMTIKADPNQTTESTPPPADPGNKPKDDFNWIPVIVIAAIVVVGAGTAVVVIVIKKKKN